MRLFGTAQRSLISKIERILGMALLAALMVTLLVVTGQEARTRRAKTQDQAQAWLSAVALQAEPILLFMDEGSARELLNKSSAYPGLEAVDITLKDGSPFAAWAGRDQKPIEGTADQTSFFASHLYASRPIQDGQETIGYLRARIDLRALWVELLVFIGTMVLVMAITGAVAGTIARRFLISAIQPAVDLKQVMSLVSEEQNYSVRAEVTSDDELGKLSEGFNLMLEQIENRDQLLEVNNANLMALKIQAEHSSQVKSDFLALMSHELRTPMAGVIGMLNLALKAKINPKVREQVTLARNNADSLLAIVNDLLDISKIEAGKLELEKIDFDFRDSMEDGMRMLRERAEQKSLGFAMHIHPWVPQYVAADPTRLRQILINLVGNAIKFTTNGSIVVAVSPIESDASGPAWFRFEIIDSGVGMTEEARSRMFRKFEQADSSTTRKYGGTGLGLSICKQLVELMGGRIGVASEVGKGSTFWFEIPLHKGQKPEETNAYVLAPHDVSLHVLVAEDVATNQIIINALLEEMGHTVTIAENGELALHALSYQDFDLILMDGRMPVMDGLDATRHIRRGAWNGLTFANPAIPIIALTANASDTDRTNFVGAGMDDFLTKPIDETALHKAISRVIAAHKSHANAAKVGFSISGSDAPAQGTTAQNSSSELDALDALLSVDVELDSAPTPVEATPAIAPKASTPSTAKGHAFLQDRKAKDEALRKRMLSVFAQDLPLRLKEVSNAVEAGLWSSAAIVVHGIKGSAAYIWPDSDVYRLAAKLEGQADRMEAEEFLVGFAKLKEDLSQLIDEAKAAA
jgi:signal transduction histidine kinase/DNA-binding response OmpR family regulator/HPt (histidine-containing phosphotransfer) domain-containing protein